MLQDRACFVGSRINHASLLDLMLRCGNSPSRSREMVTVTISAQACLPPTYSRHGKGMCDNVRTICSNNLQRKYIQSSMILKKKK